MRYLIAILILGFCTIGLAQETFSNIKEQYVTGIESQCEVAEFLFKDLNNDQYDEFIIIGKEGQVKTYSSQSEEGEFKENSEGVTLAFPNQSLLSLSSFDTNDKNLFLICLTPEGLFAYPTKEDGSFVQDGILVNRRMKFTFRIDKPVFAKFFQDINQDGQMDVIVPVMNYCEIWINTSKESSSDNDKVPEFSKIGKFPIEMQHGRETDLQNSQGKLSENFSIPNLTLKDINNDGNLDLVVSHNPNYDYYLLNDDGIIPEQPTVSLDLSLFQDTTPKAQGVQFGETLTINNEPQLLETDLNYDKIPDYIIFHQRKLWIFHGTSDGPQFTEPSSIIKIAEDITFLLPIPLNEDEFPDLLMLKVQVPTVSKLLMGFFSDWDIKTETIGYKSIDGSSFELSSTWKGKIFLRLPSILSMIRNPEMFDGFDFEQKYGPALYGDYNGDGFIDLAMTNTDNKNLEVWFGKEENQYKPERENGVVSGDAEKISKLLFSETDNVWDLDRIITTVNSLINDKHAAITRGESPDFGISRFEDKEDLKVLSIDYNHDEKHELLFMYSDPEIDNNVKFELYKLTRE